jgi:hypothetical protein
LVTQTRRKGTFRLMASSIAYCAAPMAIAEPSMPTTTGVAAPPSLILHSNPLVSHRRYLVPAAV